MAKTQEETLNASGTTTKKPYPKNRKSRISNPKEYLFKYTTIGYSNGCMYWIGDKTHFGYGRTTINGVRKVAHKVMYELFYNTKVADNMCVCHRCDNPSCVNPKHMFIGTISDNNKDKTAKGRNVSHFKYDNPTQKLTKDQAIEIIKRSHNGERPTDLAKTYGVTPSNIIMIRKGTNWKCINREELILCSHQNGC